LAIRATNVVCRGGAVRKALVTTAFDRPAAWMIEGEGPFKSRERASHTASDRTEVIFKGRRPFSRR
jgi:hypothetical protein